MTRNIGVPDRMINYTASYTDQYELTMAQAYFLKGRENERAVFDYFFRKTPFGGGYAVFAGLEDLLEVLEKLHFSKADIDFLRQVGLNKEFLDFLGSFRFTGTIRASREGDLVLPVRPVLSVEASIIEAQILETLVLNMLNFQTLVATKASRMRLAAGNRGLVDFGLRRAQGPGGYYAARAAYIGGFDATSNVRSGRDYGIPVSGTMAHSFVQSYDDEISAFRDFAEARPDDCVLLVDTYDTLKSGIPNAIRVGREMEKRGDRLKGIRLDSGDLAWLARRSRRMLDEAGLGYVKIAASNQLDENVIKSLLDQQAPIDLFGVGTSLVTGQPDAALDGVYKLAYANKKPRLKLSETPDKINLPGTKQVYRLLTAGDSFYGADLVTLEGETKVEIMYHPTDSNKNLALNDFKKQPLLNKVMENGRRLTEPKTVEDVARYSRQQVNRLPQEYRRFENAHLYKIGLSEQLKKERDRLVELYQSGTQNRSPVLSE